MKGVLMGTVKDISALTPSAQNACRLFLEECACDGLPVLITETYRSQERQNELYSQGRTTPGKIVTWTKNSRHTSRRAWDICKNIKGMEYSDVNFFRACGKIAENLGITWGGNWKTPDMPHFEIPLDWQNPKEGNCMTATEKQEFNNLQNSVDELKAVVSELKNSRERVYRYTAELPEWAMPAVQKMLDNGIYSGNAEDDLNLPETLMRTLVILDRIGCINKGQ